MTSEFYAVFFSICLPASVTVLEEEESDFEFVDDESMAENYCMLCVLHQ